MCGIAGILLAPHAADPRRLSPICAMATALHHRGPDDGGVWVDHEAGVALGHRRLAVIDLSAAGHQPMASQSGGLVISFNGEIYNFAEVRRELHLLGRHFRGHSDTEVVLEAFESFGIEGALRRFAGMFALGLWDRRARVLHLIRDRLGKKPLYVTVTDGALLFASELKALLHFPSFHPKIDRNAVAAVLRHGWVPDNQCIWQGTFKLLPGTMLSVCADDLNAGGALCIRERIRTWWSLAEVAAKGQEHLLDPLDPELETELDSRLRLAVAERMLADVPLGAFLSGGIDSSLVVALMQAQTARRVRTFTIGYRESQYDEAAAASQIARHLGTDHTEFRVTPADACSVLSELPSVWDEPFADESQIPTLLLSRLARRHVTVALSGDGGDENFGGYARHFAAPSLAYVLRLPLVSRRAAASALRMFGPEVQERLLRVLPVPAGVRRRLADDKLPQVLDAADERDLYQRLTSLGPEFTSAAQISGSVDGVPPLAGLAARLMYRDMATYLPSDILVKVDRATMAVALEARCPLLDHRLVEFAWRIPLTAKVRDGRGKWLLRRVLRRYLPDALFERPKHGFDVPIGAWLRGPLRDWAEDLVAKSRIAEEGFLDRDRIRKCWLEHVDGRRDRGNQLWAILMLEAWLRFSAQAAMK